MTQENYTKAEKELACLICGEDCPNSKGKKVNIYPPIPDMFPICLRELEAARRLYAAGYRKVETEKPETISQEEYLKQQLEG